MSSQHKNVLTSIAISEKYTHTHTHTFYKENGNKSQNLLSIVDLSFLVVSCFRSEASLHIQCSVSSFQEHERLDEQLLRAAQPFTQEIFIFKLHWFGSSLV